MGVIPTSETPRTLRDRAVKEKLQELRQTDNVTNWLYLARAWAVILLAVAGVVAFHQWTLSAEWNPAWTLLVWVPAVVVIGASQHQLAALTHEAVHYALFRGRLLNEAVSDWFCSFPLFSSTYTYRVFHLAHHQFVNDPDQDPDAGQLRKSGHWLNFPATKGQLLRTLLWQATLIPLVRYILVRAKYNAFGSDTGPYAYKDRYVSPRPKRIGVLHALGLFALMVTLSLTAPLWVVLAVPVALTLVVLAVLRSIPADHYFVTKVPPVIAPKATAMSRVTFNFLLFTGLGVAAHFFGGVVWLYFLALWVVPIFTAFSLFMILRQVVQHGNADRGWLTNSRTFLIRPLIRYAVFPLGMDYHLPHHLYATVPHYNLAKLHAFLMQVPEYREQAVIVEGYFASPHAHPPRNPTVVEVLGPEYHKAGDDVYIDDTVLNAPAT